MFFLHDSYRGKNNVNLLLGDLSDRELLLKVCRDVDVIFHAAALKHVILSERSPEISIRTNIVGSQNVIDAARTCGVKSIIFTSSDKAVNPTSVMGASKLLGERLMTAANLNATNGDPKFFSTRFGNVLGSSGSVIPIFHQQIAAGGPITVTHGEMTRFIMSLEHSVKLVIDSVPLAEGGEVFVSRMPVARIIDLATVMIDELAPQYGYNPADIRIDISGTRAGEKLYEELLTNEESRRAYGLDNHIVIEPEILANDGFRNGANGGSHNGSNGGSHNGNGNGNGIEPHQCRRNTKELGALRSDIQTPLTQDELRHFLIDNGLLEVNQNGRLVS